MASRKERWPSNEQRSDSEDSGGKAVPGLLFGSCLDLFSIPLMSLELIHLMIVVGA